MRTPAERLERGYEPSDVSVGKVLLFGGSLAVLIAAALAICGWIAAGLGHPESAAPAEGEPPRVLPATAREPLLRAKASVEYREHYEREEELVSTYGWIDPERGTVRIPVERAMQLLAERASGEAVDGEEDAEDDAAGEDER